MLVAGEEYTVLDAEGLRGRMIRYRDECFSGERFDPERAIVFSHVVALLGLAIPVLFAEKPKNKEGAAL